jgi:uncharacterized protein YlxW (UPF0749 family)
MERRIAELREGAERAEQEGRGDEADRLRQQALKLAVEAEELGRRRENGDMNEQPNRLERQVEQLRDQVNGLRKEIEELKEIVRNRASER